MQLHLSASVSAPQREMPVCARSQMHAAAVVGGGLTARLGLALFAVYLNQQLDKNNMIFPPAHLHFHLLLCRLPAFPDLVAGVHHTQTVTGRNHQVLWRKVVVTIYPN